MICLPPIANREGCALLTPPAKEHEYLKSMLDALGGCVECANGDIMNAMMVPGCLMGPMYGIMRNNRDWLGEMNVHSFDIGAVSILDAHVMFLATVLILKSNKVYRQRMQATSWAEHI